MERVEHKKILAFFKSIFIEDILAYEVNTINNKVCLRNNSKNKLLMLD